MSDATGRGAQDRAASMLSGWLNDLFDPSLSADALQLMRETQRKGLETAARIVDRVTALVDQTAPHGAATAAGRAREQSAAGAVDDEGLRTLRSDSLKAIDSLSDLMIRLVDTTIDRLGAAASSNPTAPHNASPVRLGPVAPGSSVDAPLHLGGVVAPLRLRSSNFESAGGHLIDRSAMSFDPDEVTVASNVPVNVTICVRSDCEDGVYFGTIFATGIESAAVPAEILVQRAQ